jgi:hypothetical protein
MANLQQNRNGAWTLVHDKIQKQGAWTLVHE